MSSVDPTYQYCYNQANIVSGKYRASSVVAGALQIEGSPYTMVIRGAPIMAITDTGAIPYAVAVEFLNALEIDPTAYPFGASNTYGIVKGIYAYTIVDGGLGTVTISTSSHSF